MRYLHPDVLDNGHALIQSSATRAVLIPFGSTNFAQVNAVALASSPVTQADFAISDEGTGRKIVFGGVTAQANAGISITNTLHMAYTDGVSRVLWVEAVRPAIILGGQNYRLPSQTLISTQPKAPE